MGTLSDSILEKRNESLKIAGAQGLEKTFLKILNTNILPLN